MSPRPIMEDDLHALVDGALDGVRQAEVERYLAEHHEVARKVERYREQHAALRAALRPIGDEPVPARFDLNRMMAPRRRFDVRWWQAVAASVVFMLGATAGWSVRLPPRAVGGVAAVAQEAVENFAVYGPDQLHPVEIRATDKDGLTTWFANRLGRPIVTPDLSTSGYRLMGGRVVATPHGPAAMLMYDDDHGTRIAILVRPMQDGTRSAPMNAHRTDAVDGFAWADDGLGYTVVGPAPASALRPLAEEIRRQFDRV